MCKIKSNMCIDIFFVSDIFIFKKITILKGDVKEELKHEKEERAKNTQRETKRIFEKSFH